MNTIHPSEDEVLTDAVESLRDSAKALALIADRFDDASLRETAAMLDAASVTEPSHLLAPLAMALQSLARGAYQEPIVTDCSSVYEMLDTAERANTYAQMLGAVSVALNAAATLAQATEGVRVDA